MRSVPVAAAAGAALLAAAAAGASTASVTLPVSATVTTACSVAALPLAFGNYTPLAGAVTGTTRIRVGCTRGTRFKVALGLGATPGSTVAQRLLGNGGHTLQYNLYTNPAHTRVWADGTAGSRTRGGRGRGPARPVALTAYGLLPDSAANRLAVPGTYSATIVVSVSY
ncbi:MAG TPA: spore coat U domain-containing protein [Steroidobacteraceae bacterium]|nr:spore coat U domain-containing protein [Steroidobacteraceae bacterium]